MGGSDRFEERAQFEQEEAWFELEEGGAVDWGERLEPSMWNLQGRWRVLSLSVSSSLLSLLWLIHLCSGGLTAGALSSEHDSETSQQDRTLTNILPVDPDCSRSSELQNRPM